MDFSRQTLIDLLLPRAQTSELDRLMAAAGSAHLAARRNLALAVAEDDRETSRRAALAARATDLEARALEAIAAGRDDLASRAADAIAALETEVAASTAAASRFAEKMATSRREVEAQRRRLADLDRGCRLAKLGSAPHDPKRHADGVPFIDRAEAALAAIETAQAGDEAGRREFAPTPEALADAMAEAGFGPPTRVLPADVMTRLRARAIAAPVASDA